MSLNLTDDLKKIFLAGVGATAMTAEKAGDILNELVKKGEITVAQGKELNQELRHTIREKRDSARAAASAGKEETPDAEKEDENGAEDLARTISSLSDAQKEELQKLLDSFKNQNTSEKE